MASVIKAGNATDGIAISSDNTGILELKTGTGSGTTAMTVGTGQNVTFAQAANLPNTFGFKNRIINGNMVIDQRNAGASVTVTTAGTYTLDRWMFEISQSSKFSVQRNAGSVTPPAGFTNYIGITSLSAYSVGSSDYFILRQIIEGFNTADLAWGTASAQTVTLSFWVRSSLTGAFGGSINNNANNRSYPFTYTISAANTWEQKSITIPGDTSGTWETGSGRGLNLQLGFGVGSTLSGTAGAWAAGNFLSATGAVSVVGTNGATFYITGVQLEKGSTATSFDYRPYGTELQLCQRYYYRNGVSSVTNQMTWLVGVITSSTNCTRCIMRHPVPMRATPTFGYSSLRGYDGGSATAVSSISSNQCSQDMAQVDIVCSGASFTLGRAALILENGSTAYIDCTAEL